MERAAESLSKLKNFNEFSFAAPLDSTETELYPKLPEVGWTTELGKWKILKKFLEPNTEPRPKLSGVFGGLYD